LNSDSLLDQNSLWTDGEFKAGQEREEDGKMTKAAGPIHRNVARASANGS